MCTEMDLAAGRDSLMTGVIQFYETSRGEISANLCQHY